MPHVSVTIPAFGHADYIGRTIESVLSQDHSDLDALVVDDGSPDETFEIARSYESDPRVRCVRNPENLGLVRNWNRCLELARGPLVMVLGDDDMLDSGYLSAVSRVFTEHPELGLAHAPVRIVNRADEVVEPGRPRTSRLYPAGDEAVATLLRNGIATVTTVLRKACIDELGGYDESILDTPDIELAARIASRFDVFDLGEVGGSFRLHGAKWGHLSYAREDALDSYMNGNRRAWSHLTKEGREALGVGDLDAFIDRDGSRFAFDGALVSIAYGRPGDAARYLRRGARLDGSFWRRRRFWQALLLLTIFPIGRRLMRWRMKLDPAQA